MGSGWPFSIQSSSSTLHSLQLVPPRGTKDHNSPGAPNPIHLCNLQSEKALSLDSRSLNCPFFSGRLEESQEIPFLLDLAQVLLAQDVPARKCPSDADGPTGYSHDALLRDTGR